MGASYSFRDDLLYPPAAAAGGAVVAGHALQRALQNGFAVAGMTVVAPVCPAFHLFADGVSHGFIHKFISALIEICFSPTRTDTCLPVPICRRWRRNHNFARRL